MDYSPNTEQLFTDGYTIINNVFNESEIISIINKIEEADRSRPTFRKTADLFAIRQFLKELPEVKAEIFNEKFNHLISHFFCDDYFTVKSIYFDKPENSNWFVAYHQDLTISVNQKTELPGFGPWTVKHNQFAVQPPVNVLQDNFTIRIHLDETDETNGALKVIPGSHNKGIYRPETINWDAEKDTFCIVQCGGIMIMRPLLLHASNRSVGFRRRRVIHVEFSKINLPEPLLWSEKV